MRALPRRLFVIAAVLLWAGSVRAQPARIFGFRGDLSGRFPDAAPPAEFGPKTLAWKAPLGGWGNGSPVVAGGRVFVTAEPYWLVALDDKTGKELWRRRVSKADTMDGPARAEMEAKLARLDSARAEREAKAGEARRLKLAARKAKGGAEARKALDALSPRLMELDAEIAALERLSPRIESLVGTASATPVTDGKRVCSLWGNYVAACHDLDGRLLWAREVHDEAFRKNGYLMNGHFEGQAASPWIWRDRLIVPLGKLRALHLETGRTLWEHQPYRDYGTVAFSEAAGVPVVVTPSGVALALEDGRWIDEMRMRIRYVAPIAADGSVYFIGGMEQPTRTLAAAVRFGKTGEVQTFWNETHSFTEPYAGTLVDGDRIWLFSFLGDLAVIDRKTGAFAHVSKIAWSPETPYASPALAADGVYVFTQDGKGGVFDRNPPFEVKRRLDVGEQVRASPVFIGKRAYVRTLTALSVYEAK